MSERGARLVLALLVAGLAGVALRTDLASLSGGGFWGDGATYYSAAWSLAEDHDLVWDQDARDAFRVRREFKEGAQGVFLKRAWGGLAFDRGTGFPWLRRVPESKPRVYYAKPFTYPAVAAPFVRLFRTPGLLLVNALAIGLALVLAYAELRRGSPPGPALLGSAALVLASAAPVYLFWPTPEALGLGLVAAGLFAWRRGLPLVSAAIFGLAIYSKPPNLFLAIPLGLEPLLAGGPWFRRLGESLRRGAVLAMATLAFYGLNMAITGEWNYQGGRERKTFYGTLPYEARNVTFGNSGIWMSTNQVGPSVEGRDAQATAQGQEPPRSAAELRAAFLSNLGYFWVGRFGGVVPYFFAFGAATAAFLLLGPRDRSGASALLALAVSWLFYIWMIPDNWYGGSGTLGNRYFLNLLPLGAFLVPRGRAGLVGAFGLAGGLLFVAPLLASPVRSSLRPGEHAMRAPYRWLPAELTMLNDLGVFGEPWRKKRPVGDTEGDPKRPGSADPAAYFLYFPDDGAFGREERDGAVGFWLRGGAPAEVFVRALEPVRRMSVRVTGGPAADEVTVAVDGKSATLHVAPGETRQARFEGLPRGFQYKDTFVHVLKLRSQRGGPSPDGRRLGAFVRIDLEAAPRMPR